jgi:hypothetical protein
MDKVKRYDWALPGDTGRYCHLSPDDLRVDGLYQRPEVSERNTLSIAREFDWTSFGVLIVMQRSDGSMWIVDGQQRWLAAKRRGDIETVPCIVFRSDGQEHEAKAFFSVNTKRKFVSSIAKFNANAIANESPERQIAEWLQWNGLHIGDGTTLGAVGFPTLLIDTWKQDASLCKAALLVQLQIDPEQPLNGTIHKGLFHLLWHGFDMNEHVEKIKSLGGRDKMLREITRMAHKHDQARSPSIAADGILEVINVGRSRKLRLPRDRRNESSVKMREIA